MKRIQDYKLAEQSFNTATILGILIIIGNFFLFSISDIGINIHQNLLIIGSLSIIYLAIYIALLVLHIVAIVLTYQIAKKKERNAISWAVLALIIPPIAIIVVANLKEKFENDKIKETVLRTREEYNINLGSIYNNHTINKSEQNELIAQIENKYVLILQKRLIELKADSLIEYLKSIKSEEQIDVDFDEQYQKRILMENISNNLFNHDGDFKKCPACDSIISDESIICSECEIVLK